MVPDTTPEQRRLPMERKGARVVVAGLCSHVARHHHTPRPAAHCTYLRRRAQVPPCGGGGVGGEGASHLLPGQPRWREVLVGRLLPRHLTLAPHLGTLTWHLNLAPQVAGGSISEAREEAARLVAKEEGVHMLQGHDDPMILAGQVSSG